MGGSPSGQGRLQWASLSFKKKGLKENEEEFEIKKPVFESDLIFEGIAAQLRLSTISKTFLGKLFDMI